MLRCALDLRYNFRMEDVLLKNIADLESNLKELRDELDSMDCGIYPKYFKTLEQIKNKEDRLQALQKAKQLVTKSK